MKKNTRIFSTNNEPLPLKQSDAENSAPATTLRRVVEFSPSAPAPKAATSYPVERPGKTSKNVQKSNAAQQKNKKPPHPPKKQAAAGHNASENTPAQPEKPRVTRKTAPKNAADRQLSHGKTDAHMSAADARPTPATGSGASTVESPNVSAAAISPDTVPEAPGKTAISTTKLRFKDCRPDKRSFKHKEKNARKHASGDTPQPQPDAPFKPKFAKPAPGSGLTSADRQFNLGLESRERIRTIRKKQLENSRKSDLFQKKSGPFSRNRFTLDPGAATDLDKITQKICTQLMLSSWSAVTWIRAIAGLSPMFAQVMDAAIGYVQQGLHRSLVTFDEDDFVPGMLCANVMDVHVQFSLHTYQSGQWDTVVSKLSAQASFSTDILNGMLTENFDKAFKQGSVSLFPQKASEITCQCSECHADACPHIGAVILTIAQLIEADPCSLLKLRGIEKDNLLERLRNSRSDQVLDDRTQRGRNFELPATNTELFKNFFNAKGDLEAFQTNFHYETSTLLKRLRNPPQWSAPITLERCLRPIMKLAALDAEQYAACRALNDATDDNDLITNDFGFLYHDIPQDVIDAMSRPLPDALLDILKNLLPRHGSDIRTLARQARVKKSDVAAITDSLLRHGILNRDGDTEKARYSLNPEYQDILK